MENKIFTNFSEIEFRRKNSFKKSLQSIKIKIPNCLTSLDLNSMIFASFIEKPPDITNILQEFEDKLFLKENKNICNLRNENQSIGQVNLESKNEELIGERINYSFFDQKKIDLFVNKEAELGINKEVGHPKNFQFGSSIDSQIKQSEIPKINQLEALEIKEPGNSPNKKLEIPETNQYKPQQFGQLSVKSSIQSNNPQISQLDHQIISQLDHQIISQSNNQIISQSNQLNIDQLSNEELNSLIADFCYKSLLELQKIHFNDNLYSNELNIPICNFFVQLLIKKEEKIAFNNLESSEILNFKKTINKKLTQITAFKEQIDEIFGDFKLLTLQHKKIFAEKFIDFASKDLVLRPNMSNIYSYINCKLYDEQLQLILTSILFRRNEISLGAYYIYFTTLKNKKKYKQAYFFIKSVLVVKPNDFSGNVICDFFEVFLENWERDCKDWLKEIGEYIDIYKNEIKDNGLRHRIGVIKSRIFNN